MDPIDQPRKARLSAGEWLFQLTTITIGVLIALSFDARVASIDDGLNLLAEIDAGVEPTVHEVTLGFNFPSLNDAGWQTAEGTGAIALMEYSEVQELAELYALQELFTDTLQPVMVASTEAGVTMNTPGDPFASAAVRDSVRSRLLAVRAYWELGRQLGAQLSEGYSKLQQ